MSPPDGRPGEGTGGAVRYGEERGVVRLVLHRPPLNVLDEAALAELEEALGRAAGSEARAVCLSGHGEAFCAGVAVEDHLPDRVEATLGRFGRVVERLLDLSAPVVAAVHGAALGGGCELVAACDVVLAREDARLGQPEIRLGVFPPAACALLPRLLGRQRALDLILTGRTLGAREALEAGLVQRVLPEEEFEDRVGAFLAHLAGLSRPVLRLAKRAVREGTDRSLAEALRGAERIYLEELMRLHDPVEGLTSFLEKREPAWRDA